MRRFVFLLPFILPLTVFAQTPCSQCHPTQPIQIKNHLDFSSLNASSCSSCHSGNGKSIFYILHKGHLKKVPCTTCHENKNGKVNLLAANSNSNQNTIKEDDFELYEELFDTFSGTTSRLHLRNRNSCSSCHTDGIPVEGAQVSNEICLSCHGSYEDLAKKTRSDKKANPHESHQGKLECSRCHKGHETSRSYCTECHANFNQVMPEVK
ncbi:cytochrome c3 family protein [uncultured Parasutterella sp.]|uniref:Tetrahaem cytochrome domain-containing protein n=1 Tax=Parasutterella muris TaxID=2565572 RepID=A0A6L6YPJ3_9BURK|nr:hypothetical protein [Parasutterella muris]